MKKIRKPNAKKRPDTKIPEWLPNWRNHSEYPDPDKTTARQWAWQFFRRNQEFQEMWEKHVVPICDKKGAVDETAFVYLIDGVIVQKQKFNKALAAREKHKYAEIHPLNLIEKKFEVGNIRSPAEPTNPYFSYRLDNLSYMSGRFAGQDGAFAGPKLMPNEILIRFNLDMPHGPQLEEARIRLDKEEKFLHGGKQVSHSRNRLYNNFQKYLRELDASLCGEKREDIAKVFYPHPADQVGAGKQVSKDIRIARHLCKSGFHSISTVTRR